MNIYFVGSLTGKNQLESEYRQIIAILEAAGHEVNQTTLESTTDSVSALSEQEKQDFYRRAVAMMQAADLVIAEVSHPSLGVGHEITVALDKGKPVVAAHKGTTASQILQGIQSEKLIVVDYTPETLKEVLLEAIDFAKEQSDTRFNFFISPKQTQYLEWVSKHYRIPRSVYLRNLIKEDMEKNSSS